MSIETTLRKNGINGLNTNRLTCLVHMLVIALFDLDSLIRVSKIVDDKDMMIELILLHEMAAYHTWGYPMYGTELLKKVSRVEGFGRLMLLQNARDMVLNKNTFRFSQNTSDPKVIRDLIPQILDWCIRGKREKSIDLLSLSDEWYHDDSLGQFFTPVSLCEWVVGCLPTLGVNSVLDPSCGAGHLLWAFDQHHKCPNTRIYGLEVDHSLFRVAQMLNHLSFGSFEINYGNTLDLSTVIPAVDCVVGNPPYSKDGVLEYEFTQVVLHSLVEGGILAWILPSSVFSAKRYQKTLSMIEHQLNISAIVHLPSVFTHTNTHTSVVIGRKQEESTDQEKLVVDWSRYKSSKNQQDVLPSESGIIQKKIYDLMYQRSP